MIERAPHQTLEALALQVNIDHCVDSGLFGVTKRLGTWNAKSDDQDLRPFEPHFLEQLVALAIPQIKEENSRGTLLHYRVEPCGCLHQSNLDPIAKKRAGSPNEMEVLRINDAGRGENHAAATSSWKRTRGRRIWKLVPRLSSLSTSIWPPCSCTIP